MAVPLSVLFGIVNLRFMVSFYLVAVLYGTILSVGSLLLEVNTFRKYPKIDQMMKLFLFAVIDNLGYRQLNTLYKVEAMSGFRRNRSSWGAIQRRAFRDDGKSGEKAAPEK